MPRSTALNDNDRGAPVVAAKNKANNWVANHGRDFAQHKLKQNGVNQVCESKLLKHVVNDRPFFSGIAPCSRPHNLVIRSRSFPPVL
jgi:hypothetical protein